VSSSLTFSFGAPTRPSLPCLSFSFPQAGPLLPSCCFLSPLFLYDKRFFFFPAPVYRPLAGWPFRVCRHQQVVGPPTVSPSVPTEPGPFPSPGSRPFCFCPSSSLLAPPVLSPPSPFFLGHEQFFSFFNLSLGWPRCPAPLGKSIFRTRFFPLAFSV